MEDINKSIITAIEMIVEKYLKSTSYEKEALVTNLETDGKLRLIIDTHEYQIKNGTNIPFKVGDKCLVHCINGHENKKIIIAKL